MPNQRLAGHDGPLFVENLQPFDVRPPRLASCLEPDRPAHVLRRDRRIAAQFVALRNAQGPVGLQRSVGLNLRLKVGVAAASVELGELFEQPMRIVGEDTRARALGTAAKRGRPVWCGACDARHAGRIQQGRAEIITGDNAWGLLSEAWPVDQDIAVDLQFWGRREVGKHRGRELLLLVNPQRLHQDGAQAQCQ